MQQPRGDGPGPYRHEVAPVIGDGGGRRDRSRHLLDVKSVALAQDGAGRAEIRIVVHQRHVRHHQVERRGRGQRHGGVEQQLTSGDRERLSLELLIERDPLVPEAHFHPLHPAERVGEEAGDRAVRLPLQVDLLHIRRIHEARGIAPGDVRHLLREHAPAQPPALVLVADERRQVLEPAVHLKSGDEVVIAEQVAEKQRRPAAHVRAVAVGPDREGRRGDVRKGQLGMIRRDREGRLRGKARLGIGQLEQQGRVRGVGRRQHGGARSAQVHGPTAGELLARVDRIEAVRTFFVGGEHQPAAALRH